MSDAIVIEGVTKSFGTKVAVENLDLRVRQGALCGFIGPNGAGKTTTIRMIMAILFPDRGRISVLGRDSALESKDRIGYLPEERGVYRKMKAGAFLTYMGRLKGIDSAALKARVAQWLERVGLAESARKKCEELSKGMQQKIQFIASVIHEPDLVILDEPFSGLDPVNRRLLRELIDEQHRAGRTIIFSTHAMYEAEQLCDQIFMIHRGIKMIDATLGQIRARFDPRTLLVEPMSPGALSVEPGRIPGVARVEGGAAGGAMELHLAEGADVRMIMRSILDLAPVRRLELKPVKLEDVFIDLVERSGHEAPSRAELRTEGAGGESTGD